MQIFFFMRYFIYVNKKMHYMYPLCPFIRPSIRMSVLDNALNQIWKNGSP